MRGRPPGPTRLGEVVWLQPSPDALLEGASRCHPGRGALRAGRTISLAFLTALPLLPRRQVAVLILRDGHGFHAGEIAGTLNSATESVTSALKRARAGLQRQQPPTRPRTAPPAAPA